MDTSACVFCAIVAGQLPASKVYEDEHTLAVMDIQPITPGHVLVIPKTHFPMLADLDPAVGGLVFQVGQRVAAALRRSGLRCEGINLFLADGETAGQDVFHVHLHVFPRYAGDGFGLHYGPDYYQKPPREALDETAVRIRARLKG